MHIPLSHLNRDSVASCIGHRIVVLGSGSDERSRQVRQISYIFCLQTRVIQTLMIIRAPTVIRMT